MPDRPADAGLSPTELERVAVAGARAGAAVVREAYGHAQLIEHKSSPTDLVTQTDVDSEARVSEALLAATPAAGLLGEEGTSTRSDARLQWIIDPLDGTTNFVYGVPLFAVSVAAAIDDEVVAGAVADVMRDDVFSATRGGGARLNGEPIAVSSCASLADALVVTGFSYSAETRRHQGAVAGRLLPLARDLRSFGAAALELSWVACGRADASYERELARWDYAAGTLIAAEAGATIELPRPGNGDLVLATTPRIFAEMRAAVDLESGHPAIDVGGHHVRRGGSSGSSGTAGRIA